MADRDFIITKSKELSTMIKDLNGVGSVNINELQKVASALLGFLMYIQSADEKWSNLKLKLESKCPEFLTKVQLTYVYYFTRCLELAYVPDSNTVGSAKELENSIKLLYNNINNSSVDAYKYYKEILSGGATSYIEGSILAESFIEELLSTYAGTGREAMFHIGLDDINLRSISVQDFLKNAIPELTNILAAEKISKEATEQIEAIRQHEEPRVAFYGAILLYLRFLRLTKDKFHLKLREGSEIYEQYQILNPEDQEKVVEFIQECNATEDLKDADVLNKLVIALFEKEQPKQESQAFKSEEDERKLTDYRAILAAKYAAGRITAEELQQQDADLVAKFSSTILQEED